MPKFRLLHPFLITLIPILFIAGNNLSESPGKEIIIACLIGMSSAGIFLILCQLVVKKIELSTLITSIFIIFLFSYGPLFDLIQPQDKNASLFSVGLIFSLFIFYLITSYWISRNTKRIHLANTFVSFFSILMLIMIAFSISFQPLFISKIKKIPILFYGLLHVPSNKSHVSSFSSMKETALSNVKYPDIYYIILDGYARSDTLQKVFNHNNTDFENSLKNRGFFIAQKSTTNYPMTHLSLASSLNMDYLDCHQENANYYVDLIRKPKIAEELKKRGYDYITISSGWSPTAFPSYYSDYHFSMTFSNISNYYQTILAMTPMKAWVGSLQARVRLFAFETLEAISNQSNDKPKFVFLHLVMPHPPFFFDRQGNIININQVNDNHNYDKSQYINQLIFLNHRIKKSIDTIILNSSDSIIILQGDHGSESTFEHYKTGKLSLNQIRERYPIFNAYYGSAEFQKMLYPTITPVNTFRTVLNFLKAGQWVLLPDSNYFQWYYDETEISDVTPQVRSINS